jgi:NAD(P)-dependent dehydrogenase (short-subunit alcohol dehydrogenase family)
MSAPAGFSLAQRTILVSGGGRGIGLAIARACGAAGARVILAARSADELGQAAAALRDQGIQAWAMPSHFGKPAEIAALFERACTEIGVPDGLVNNAATSRHFGPLLEIDEATLDQIFAVNLRGYLHACRHFAAQRQQRGLAGGAIVNLASITALRGSPQLGAYAMSKAAVLSMTQTLACELGPRQIRVNAIAPGLVETRMASVLVGTPEFRDPYVQRAPLGRHGQPEDIAGAAVYLLSHAAAFMTGQTLVIDGGHTIT